MTEKRATDDWLEQMAQMREELLAWRTAHPEATFDEIVAQMTTRRQELMAALIEELAQPPETAPDPEDATGHRV
jgi:hypothetical protein